jgi:hypothetical protein
MKNIIITRASGLTEYDSSLRADPGARVFARQIVLTPDGLAILNLTHEAAAELAEALQSQLKAF